MMEEAPACAVVLCAAQRRNAREASLQPAPRREKRQPGRAALCLVRGGSLLGLAQSLLWVTAESADQRVALLDRGGKPYFLGATQHQGHTEIAAPKIGVGADLEIGVARL